MIRPGAVEAPAVVIADFAEVGRRCVAAVLRQVEQDEAERGTTLVPTRLVVRSSTAAPPGT